MIHGLKELPGCVLIDSTYLKRINIEFLIISLANSTAISLVLVSFLSLSSSLFQACLLTQARRVAVPMDGCKSTI